MKINNENELLNINKNENFDTIKENYNKN